MASACDQASLGWILCLDHLSGSFGYGILVGFRENLGDDGFCMMVRAVCGVVAVVCDLRDVIDVISLDLWVACRYDRLCGCCDVCGGFMSVWRFYECVEYICVHVVLCA